MLKSRENFSGEDALNFPSWRFQFTSWLTYGESKYVAMLKKIEALTTSPDIATYSPEERELAHRLYAVLTSYLKGRCGHLCKSMAQSRDGFAVWYHLIKEFEPSSRQRALAIAQALSNYPTFPKDRSCLESILVYEETVQRFEESSSSSYPDVLKIATLMRCCNQRVREHLQLNVDEKSSYSQVRECILNFERVSKAWSQETVLRSIQDAHRTSDSGPTPMEVDRIEKGGGKKCKSGKSGKNGKGGKGDWSFPWGAGRGFGGRGRGQGKGKKGKGRGNANKGKGKQKGKKEGGKTKDKGKVGQNQCKLCFACGHWSGECPNKMDVNYVAQGQQNSNGFEATMNPAGQHTGTASSSTTYVQQPPVQPQASTKGIVRRIFHINPSSPSSPTSPISSGSQKHVRMVLLEEVPEEFESMELVTQRVETQDGEEWIILDSGSDVSLLPSRFSADHGTQSNHSLRNCQGGALRTRGTRNADLEVRSTEGEEILLRHQFLIGDVTTGLVSLGQLYQAGWKICGDGDELVLTDPNDEVNIPVHFRNKSFAIRAHVRAVA